MLVDIHNQYWLHWLQPNLCLILLAIQDTKIMQLRLC